MDQGLLRVGTTWQLEGSLRERVGNGVGVEDGEENPGSLPQICLGGEGGCAWGRKVV